MWQGWVTLIVGIWFVISPWVFTGTPSAVTWNNVILGVIAAILGYWSVAEYNRAMTHHRS